MRKIEELEEKLRRGDIEYAASKRPDNRGICRCLERIDDADLVYIVNPSGYVGKSVSVDIDYTYARGKPIYATHTIDDPPVMNLLAGALTYEKLIELLKQ